MRPRLRWCGGADEGRVSFRSLLVRLLPWFSKPAVLRTAVNCYLDFCASTSRCFRIVCIRAMVLRVLPIWLGSSSFSVTAWLRRSNRCLRCSSSSCLRCSVSFSRISLTVMTRLPYAPGLCHRATSLHAPARDAHLVGHARQAALGGRGIDAGDLEHHGARLHDAHPVFRLALALAHARLER